MSRIIALALSVLGALAVTGPVPLVLGAQQEPPYSCRLYYDEQKKCAFGNCDARTVERLKRECLRDGGRP